MKTAVKRIFDFCHYCFNANLEGVSDELAVQKPDACNSLNWLAGHLLLIRSKFFSKLLDADLALDDKFASLYNRGTHSPDAEAAIPLSELIVLYNQSKEVLDDALSKLPESTDEEREVLEKLAFYASHEAYHIGQMGTVRKLVGLDGAIQ